MSNDEQRPSGKESAKQFAEDLRDTLGKKVADNESTLRGSIGKAARWVDSKTGGKYSTQINKAEGKVGDGIGWAASQGSGTGTSSGTPGSPGAAASDPTGPSAATGPAGSSGSTGATGPTDGPTGPVTPQSGREAQAGENPPTPPTPPKPQGPPGRPDDPPMHPAPGS